MELINSAYNYAVDLIILSVRQPAYGPGFMRRDIDTNNPANAERGANRPQRRRERDVLYSDTSLYLCVANSSGDVYYVEIQATGISRIYCGSRWLTVYLHIVGAAS